MSFCQVQGEACVTRASWEEARLDKGSLFCSVFFCCCHRNQFGNSKGRVGTFSEYSQVCPQEAATEEGTLLMALCVHGLHLSTCSAPML
jgi:hypothetical protein